MSEERSDGGGGEAAASGGRRGRGGEMNSAQLNKDMVKDIWRETTLHRETGGHTHRASFPYMRWEEVWASLLFIEQLPY